jgi:MFS family permease
MEANESHGTEDIPHPLLPEPPPAHALTRLAAYPWLVVCVACLGAFARQVDASIVQLGLPTLEHAFGTPLNEVSWVAVAYSLSFAAVLPVYARLAEMAGRKLMYILAWPCSACSRRCAVLPLASRGSLHSVSCEGSVAHCWEPTALSS